eukprot:c46430_g1_i1 orf=88-264(+)
MVVLIMHAPRGGLHCKNAFVKLCQKNLNYSWPKQPILRELKCAWWSEKIGNWHGKRLG